MTLIINSVHLQILRRLKNSMVMFLGSSVGTRAKFLVLALILLMLFINGMNVANSYVMRYFMSAIERRDMAGFSYYAWIYAGVFVFSTLFAVFFRYTEERLGLLWREWMTRRMLGLYLNKQMYLRIGTDSIVTNPDQRIAEDVRSLTTTTISFFLMITNSSITALSFAGVLWAISPTLFSVSVLYAIAGSFLTIYLGRSLVRLNYNQADYEANFRSALIKIKDDAQSIANKNLEDQTKQQLLDKFKDVTSNLLHIISVNRNLNFFTTGYNYMIQLIPILFVAPLFIKGGVDFGIIGQSSMAFATMVGAFSLLINQFQSITSYASVITRLSEFVELSEEKSQ